MILILFRNVRIYLTAIFLLCGVKYLPAQSKAEKLNSLLESYSISKKLNGTVLVSTSEGVLMYKGFGLRNVTDSLMNTEETIFQIGSVTKQFTAAAILRLCEQNKMDLEDKLSKYFPGFPYSDHISIVNLLTHTSGIFNYTDDRNFILNRALLPTTKAKMLSFLSSKPLQFEPGKNWAYSNSNYSLLGYIIEKVTGISYEQYLAAEFFVPLKMQATGFGFSKLASDNKALGYKSISDANVQESDEFDPSVSYAAGGMFSSASDLQKWQTALREGKIINKTSLGKMISPVRNKYGYGVYIDSIYGKRLIAHGGLLFGYSSYVGQVMEDNISVIILNNIVNTSVSQMAREIYAILYDKNYKLQKDQTTESLSLSELKQYEGVFQLTPQFSVEFTVEDGILCAKVTGQPKFMLSVQKKDLFFIKGMDIKVAFKRDKLRNIVEVVLLEEGRVTNGKRM